MLARSGVRFQRAEVDQVDSIDSIWSVVAPSEATGAYRFLPTGCCDIVFNGGAPLRSTDGELSLETGQIMAFGPYDSPAILTSRGGVDLLGIRFKLGRVRAFFEPSGLVGGGRPLGQISPGLQSALEGFLPRTDKFEQRSEAITSLFERLEGEFDRELTQLVEGLRSFDGGKRVRDLAADFGLGERQLERRFQQQIGLSPKRLSRILRFNAAIAMMNSAPHEALSQIALSCGFFDQAHFTREFKALSGASPARHRRQAADGFLQYDCALG